MLVVSDFRFKARRISGHRLMWKRKLWKLKNPSNGQIFRDIINEAFDGQEGKTGTYDIEDN